ncbi:MAG: PAS domain S-box protein [Desulfarculaceae bacterium]|nr:PAS domain S-box protein [Desulfarculaceae bacterium]MCF8073735.1 PAS domain S-box protein [Desulfarculaceae bacterium]MCF8101976.1 PAS domain S-box protein [Desulfarculaceae bacterium]MCF8115946.1 PAS domain S-box protein [Desulfarculaceae bacterium]
MTQPAPPKSDQAEFQRHYMEMLRSRLNIGFLTGMVLVPAFAVVDWFQVPAYFEPFLKMRLWAAALLAVMYLLNRVYAAQVWQEGLTVTAALAVAAMLEVMLIQMGMEGARYYAGLGLVLIAALVLIPVRLPVAAIIGAGVLAVYLLPQVLRQPPPTPPVILLHHGGTLTAAVLLLLLANGMHRRALVQQIWNRLAVQRREEELAQLNASLEELVAQRTADLASSEARYRSLVESNPQFIYSLDIHGAFTFVGPKVKELMGVEASQAENRHFIDFVHPDDHAHCIRAFKSLRNQGKMVTDVEFRALRADGVERIFVSYNSPLTDAEGVVVGVIGTAVDVTRQRRTTAEREQYRRELNQTLEQLEQAAMEVVMGLAGAVEAKDPYTRGHADRVRLISMAMASEAGLEAEELTKLEFAAELHDVGKIGVKGEILNKRTPLTPEEYEHIKKHPVTAEVILKDVGVLSRVRPLIRAHHERWDGGGYPDRLAGTDIPFLARIMAVADSVDAMRTQRPYRPPLSMAQTLAELKLGAGSQFDPECVALFERVLNKGDLPEL